MRIENKEEVIFALGEFLYELGLGWEWLPTVYPGTTYGENTREAVKEIQQRFDLPVTGVVDLDTWRLIYGAYREKHDKRERFPFPAGEKEAFPLQVGQRGYEVMLLRGTLGALSEYAGEYDLLINTVPARIFDRDLLSRISSEGRLIELASAPFGLDFDEAESLGVRAELASGLPGKFFPETAGYAVADTVLELLREMQILR